MPPLPPRPTWSLDDKELPAAYPAGLLDPDEAIQRALAGRKSYTRQDDVSLLQHAAITYAGECMADALAELAFRAQEVGPDAPLQGSSGWMAVSMPARSKSSLELMLVHPVEPGGWHIEMRFRPEMTPEAKARAVEIEKSMRDAGVSPIDIILASVTGKDIPFSAQMKALEADPASWIPAGRGAALTMVVGTAVDLGAKGWNGIGAGGKPRGLEEFETRASLKKRGPDQVWWSGLHLKLQPVPSHQIRDGLLTPNNDRGGACPHLPAVILSDLVRAQDLAGLVTARAERAGSMPWICFGSGDAVHLDDAGHAISHASGGLFDKSVETRIRDFSAAIAAQDVERHLEEWTDLVRSMLENNRSNEDMAFDCNDLRDIAHARSEGNTQSLFTRTQHGRFRLDLISDEAGNLQGVQAFRCSGARDHAVGRYRMEGGALQADYGPENGPEIAYEIRNIRDMNGIINSLSSVACCWEEEMKLKQEEDDSPSP